MSAWLDIDSTERNPFSFVSEDVPRKVDLGEKTSLGMTASSPSLLSVKTSKETKVLWVCLPLLLVCEYVDPFTVAAMAAVAVLH